MESLLLIENSLASEEDGIVGLRNRYPISAPDEITMICTIGMDKINIAVADRTATVVVALDVHIVLNMPQTAMATMETAKTFRPCNHPNSGHHFCPWL